MISVSAMIPAWVDEELDRISDSEETYKSKVIRDILLKSLRA